jgi:CHAT domain-containing protein
VSGDATLLHFACHGLADEASPLDSALALTLPGDWEPGRENGLLQAWEVFERLRIDADLVTLSACGTALGKQMSGEGVLGLTRAFQYAGARSVLASLWEVNDDSTAELMGRFYRHLKGGRGKAEALRAAQCEMIRRPTSSHPHRWGAFQLIGDGR